MVEILTDEYLPFVKDKMLELDLGFDNNDFEVFVQVDHTIIGYFHNQELVTFATFMHIDGKTYMAYTWCNGTKSGKVGFLKGIRFIKELYPDLEILEDSDLNVTLYNAYKRI